LANTEILRLSGCRIEEFMELSPLSGRRYTPARWQNRVVYLAAETQAELGLNRLELTGAGCAVKPDGSRCDWTAKAARSPPRWS
jgi:hypothetical protein